MSTPFPDYAKTTHPDVLESIRETARRRDEFVEKMRAVSRKYTGEDHAAYFSGWEFDRQHMTGIAAAKLLPEAKTGQWKKPKGGVIEPYRSNPASKDFAIGYKAADIPGRGNVVWGHGRMGTGLVFEHDGAAYSYFGFSRGPMTDSQAAEAEKFGWTEIMASEFHLAMETENARRKEATE